MNAQRIAGIPDDLSREQLERWTNGLVTFLTSDGVPQPYRAWATEQADAIDGFVASGGDEGDALDDDPEDDGGAASSTAREVAPAPRRRPGARQSRDALERDHALTIRVHRDTSRLLVGMMIGAAILVAVVAIRQLAFTEGGEASLPATADAPAFDQARADELEVLLNQEPENREALFELGEMNFQAGRYEDMIPWFTKLVELDPANKHALTDLGTAHFNLGQPAEAKIWWEKVVAVDANDVQAHYNLGFMYANAEPRDVPAAVREWETVLRLEPESQLAQTARVHIDSLKAELAGGSGSAPEAALTAAPRAP